MGRQCRRKLHEVQPQCGPQEQRLAAVHFAIAALQQVLGAGFALFVAQCGKRIQRGAYRAAGLSAQVFDQRFERLLPVTRTRQLLHR
ncbi:hypothetical protein D3C81_2028110 [compost metagenome]